MKNHRQTLADLLDLLKVFLHFVPQAVGLSLIAAAVFVSARVLLFR
ncbi:hypothetical protein [Azohydromonas aeria]|nr:hypothetical protein [Azohydromonas aeria]